MADNKNTPQVSKRVLDFSPVSFNTGMEGSQYKRDLSPFEKSQDVLAASQGFWDASGNFLANIVGSTAINTAGLGASLYGIGKAIGTGEFKDIWDNELAQGLDKVQKGLDEMTPFYNSEKEDKAGLFTADYLTSAGFWGNTVGKGISFIAGAYLGGAGLAKAGSTALKGLSKASKSFGKLVAGEEATSGLISAAKQGNIPGWIERAGKSSTIRNAASYYSQKISGNMFEAGMEARGVKEEILRAKTEEYAKQNPNAPEPPEWLKKQWDEDSNLFGNVAMGLNLLLLQTDGIGLGKTMYGYKTTKRTIEAARDAAGKYVELSAKRKILNKAGRVLSGGLEEGAQEGGQFIVEKTSVDLGTNDKAKSFADYVNAGFKGLEQTLGTKEGQESMLAGFLLGGGGRGIGELRGSAERNIMNKAGIEALNKFMLKDTVKPLVDLAGKSFDEGNGQVLENATEVNDKKLFLDAKAKDFFNWASTRIEMGRYEDAVEELQQLKNTPVETLDQIFPNHGLSESKKHQMFDGLLNDMKELNRMQSDVEINFGNSPYKKNILNTAYKIKNIDRRIQEMSTKDKSMLDIYHDEDLQNLLAEKEELSRDLAILMMTRPKPSNNTQEEKTSEDNKDSNKALTPTNNTPTQTPSDIVSKQERKENIVGTKIPGRGVITNISEGVATIKDENGVVTHEELDNLPNGSYEEKIFIPEPADEEDELNMVPDYSDPDTKKKDVSFVDPSINTEDPGYTYTAGEEFVQASDFGVSNFDMWDEKSKATALSSEDRANLPEIVAMKQAILDKKLDFNSLDFNYSQDSKTGRTTVTVKDKSGKEVKIGYIPNINTQLAGYSQKTILKFMEDYFTQLRGTNRKKTKDSFIPVIQGIRSLLSKMGLNITNYMRPHSRIRRGVTPFNEILNSPRFQVDGKIALAFYKDGRYEADPSLPKELQDKIHKELEKPYNKNNLGTQYVLMVERPGQPGVYTFVGVKGMKLSEEQISQYMDLVAQEPQNIANILNKDIFISSEGETIKGEDGEMYPVHYEFDRYEGTNDKGELTKAGKLYVKRFIKGTIDNAPIKQLRRSKMSIEEALRRSYLSTAKTRQEAFTPENLEKLQVNTDPQLFDLFYQFSAKKFFAEHPLEFNQDDILNKAQQEAEEAKLSKVLEVEEKLKALNEKTLATVGNTYQNTQDPSDVYDRVSTLKGSFEGSIEAADRGTIIDSLLRDFIEGKILTREALIKAYSDIAGNYSANEFSPNFLNELFTTFQEVKNIADRRKLTLKSNIPTLWGEINGQKIAGTIDLLGIAENGDVYIIDLKTSTQDRRLQYEITKRIKDAFPKEKYQQFKDKIKSFNGAIIFDERAKTLFNDEEKNFLVSLYNELKEREENSLDPEAVFQPPSDYERRVGDKIVRQLPIYFFEDDDTIQQSAYAELLRQRTGITVKMITTFPVRTFKDRDGNYVKVATSKNDKGSLSLEVPINRNIFPEVPNNFTPPVSQLQEVDLINTPSADIIAELNKLSTFQEKLDWLKNNNLLAPITINNKSYNVIDYNDRVMVLMKIGKYNIPFYISTGQAGKKNVKAGDWYVVFGIGEERGWINKGSEQDINNQYGFPVFQKLARILNEGVGKIESREDGGNGKLKNGVGFLDHSPSDPKDVREFNSQMNLPTNPAGRADDSSTFYNHVKNTLTLLSQELNNLQGQVSEEETSDVIDNATYNNFIDNNYVSDDILNSIANKVINRQNLSPRETAIFNGKTSEINEVIRNKGAQTFEIGNFTITPTDKGFTITHNDPNIGELETGVSTIEEVKEKVAEYQKLLEEADDIIDDATNKDKPKLFNQIDDKSPVEQERILREVAAFEKELARILPGIKVKVDFTKGFSYYRNAAITLASTQVSQAKWHEAFHAIFDCFSPEEKRRAIRIAAENFPINLDELVLYKDHYDRIYERDLKLFETGQLSVAPVKMSEEKLIEIMYEEKIADLFQDYMENRPVARGLFQRFFDAIARFIMHLLGRTDETPFAALFDSINKGDFANRNPNLGEENVRLKLPNSSSRQSRELIANLGVQTLSELKKNPKLEVDVFIKGQIQKYREVYKQQYAPQVGDLKKKLIKKEITPEQFSEQIEILARSNKILDKDNFYPPMLAADNESLIIDGVKRFSNLVDKYQVEIEENDEDNVEQVKNLSLMESNMDEMIEAQAVQARISYLNYLDENGMLTAVDGKAIYDNLKMNLEGVPQEKMEEVISKLAGSKRETPYTKSMREFLKLFKADQTFKTQCYNAFSNYFVPSYSAKIDIRGKVYKEGKETTGFENNIFSNNAENFVESQMQLWKNELFGKTFEKINTPEDLQKYITLQDEVFDTPEGELAIRNLISAINDKLNTNRNSVDIINMLTTGKDNIILEAVAKENIKYRTDLGDLTYKFAGKSFYSMLKQNYVFTNLKNSIYKDNWGVFTGINYRLNANRLGEQLLYKEMEPSTYLLTNLQLYTKEWYIPQQMENKSTVVMVKGSSKTELDLKKDITAEIARQNSLINGYIKELQEGKGIVEGFHVYKNVPEEIKKIKGFEKFNNTPKEILNLIQKGVKRSLLPRAYQYINIVGANETLSTQSAVYNEEATQNFIASDILELKELIADLGVPEELLSNLLSLDKKDSVGYEKAIKNFIISQYLNRMQMLSVINPELTKYKDFVDITKRGAGLLLSGPSHYNAGKPATFGTVVLQDVEYNINPDTMERSEKGQTIKATDGQSVETIGRRYDRHLRLGRSSEDPNNDFYRQAEILQAYMDDDRDKIAALDSSNMALMVDKTGGFDGKKYIKTSIFPLTRYFTSYEVKAGTEGAVVDTYNGKSYLPYPHRLQSFSQLNKLQTLEVEVTNAKRASGEIGKDQNIYFEAHFASAIKLGLSDINSLDSEKYSYSEFSNANYRLQQENPSGKDEIKDGTQLIQLIGAFLPDNLNYTGELGTYSGKEGKAALLNTMHKLLADLREFDRKMIPNSFKKLQLLAEVNGGVYVPFIKYLQDSKESSAASDNDQEYLASKDGEFIYSQNMPHLINGYEQAFISYFNKNLFSQKTDGGKATLVSATYSEVMEFEGKVITTWEFENKLTAKQRAQVTTRPLKVHKPGGNSEDAYAEVILSEEYLIDILGITLKDYHGLSDFMQDRVKTILGFRIPTQSHHSMMPCKVVDFAPRHYGSMVVAPAEITYLSGADYDVDSLFYQRYSFYKNENDELSLVQLDYGSYLSTVKDNKIVKEYMEMNSPKIKEYKVDIAKTKASIQANKALLNKYVKNPSLAPSKDSIANVSRTIDENEKFLKATKRELFRVQREALKTVLKALNFPTTEKEFNEKKSNNEAGKFIKNYNNNALLSTRLNILTSDFDGKFLPAVDKFQELNNKEDGAFKKYFPKAKTSEVYTSFVTFIKHYINNYAGGKAIGASANGNKVFAHLESTNTSLSNTALLNLTSSLSQNLFTNTNRIDAVDYQFKVVNGRLVFGDRYNDSKPDNLSSAVSMTVDNVKEQTLVKFNLNDKIMPLLTAAFGIGIGNNLMATFLLNPITKVFTQRFMRESSPLTEGISKMADTISEMKGVLTRDPLFTINENNINDFADDAFLNSEENYKFLNDFMERKIDPKTLNEDQIKFLKRQAALLDLYESLALIAEDSFVINTVLNLNKELGEQSSDVDYVLARYKKAMEGDIPDKGIYFSFDYRQNVPASVKANINSVTTAKEILDDNLLFYGSSFEDVFDNIDNVSLRPPNSKTEFESRVGIRKELLNFLIIKAYSKFNQGDIDINNLSLIQGKLVELYEANKDKIIKYPFGQMLTRIKASRQYPYERIGIDSFKKLDARKKDDIMDSFGGMLQDPETREFASSLLSYIATHDNFRFIGQSAVSFMRPSIFNSLNEIIKGTDMFGGIEGMFVNNKLDTQAVAENLTQDGSFLKLFKDFLSFWYSDNRNNSKLRYVGKYVNGRCIVTNNEETFQFVDIKNPPLVAKLFVENPDGGRNTIPLIFDRVIEGVAHYIPIKKTNSSWKLYQLEYGPYVDFYNNENNKAAGDFTGTFIQNAINSINKRATAEAIKIYLDSVKLNEDNMPEQIREAVNARLLSLKGSSTQVSTQPTKTSTSTPIADIPQNKVSGIESFGSTVTANDEIIKALGPNPHSIDMIEAGFRTRTTRSETEMAKYAIKVGDVIKHFGRSANGKNKEVLARVTAIHPKGSPGWKGTWEKEGWRKENVNVIDRFKDGAAAIEFEVIKPTQPPAGTVNIQPTVQEVQGINIKSDKNTPNSLANRLTNPNWYAKDLMDVEGPYKANKSKNTNPEEALKEDMNTMYTLQVQKFRQNPELIDEINNAGGLEFIKKSSHVVGVKNSRWEGVGMQSNFIKVLVKSYEKVSKELGKFVEGKPVAETKTPVTTVIPEILTPAGQTFIEINGRKIDTFRWDKENKIPISLTRDQERAVRNIIAHMETKPDVPFILKGKAGTGKTTVIRVINEYFKNKESIIITPTHKAGKNASMVTYGNTQDRYKTFASCYFGFRSAEKELTIFDEISMLGDYDKKTFDKKKKPNINYIFMGDQRQLPPVKDNKLSAFFNSKDNTNVYELTEVMRFDQQGAIFKIADHLAENLKIYNPIKQYPAKLVSDKDTVYSVDSSKRLVDSYMHFYRQEGNDPSKVRLIAYGNPTVEKYNNIIRNIIYKGNAQYNIVNNNDLLTGNMGWTTKDVLLNPMVNSSEYLVIEDPRMGESTFSTDGNVFNYRGQQIAFKEVVGDEFSTERNITIVDPEDSANKDILSYIATNIINMANLERPLQFDSRYNDNLSRIEKSGIYTLKTMYAKTTSFDPQTKAVNGVELYTLEQMLEIIRRENPTLSEDAIMNMIDNNKFKQYYKIASNVSFGYAITTHKSQGSTYKHVMVDEANMSFKDSSRLVYDQSGDFYAYEANQMRYVGFSRPTTTLVIYTKKPIGDQLIYETESATLPNMDQGMSSPFDDTPVPPSETYTATADDKKGALSIDDLFGDEKMKLNRSLFGLPEPQDAGPRVISTDARNIVISKIKANFELYKNALGIESVEQIDNMNNSELATLIKNFCKI